MDKEVRDIRVVFLVFSAVLFFIAYRNYPSGPGLAAFASGGALLGYLSFCPLRLRPAFSIWLRVARAVGRVNIRILLFLVFVFIFIPFGLIMRLTGHDPMHRRLRRGSYWEPYGLSGLKDNRRYERQF